MNRKLWAKTGAALLLSVLSFPLASSSINPVLAAENTAAALGKAAPTFTLTDSNGKKHSLEEGKGKIVVLEWTNYDCPFVKRQYSTGAMQKLQKTYTGKGVLWFSICSSAEGRQGNYSAAKINELIKQNNASPTAYLLDPDGTAGHAYGATCTPDMFIINDKGELAYSGAVDDNQTADATEKINVNYVQKALDELLAKKPISIASSKAMGCSVKYKQ